MEASKLILYIGSIHSQTLGGLGAAGYTWDYVIEGPSDILSVSLKTVAPPTAPLPSSYNSDYVYTITTLKLGNTRIRFYLHRTWEHDKPPLREVIMDVSVIQH